MARLALLGAVDTRLTDEVARRALAAGHEVVRVGRAPALDDHADAAREAPSTSVRTVDTTDERALAGSFRGVDAVVACTHGPATDVARAASVRCGVPLVDADAEVPRMRTARHQLDADAASAGLPVVAGVSWRTALGDLLAAVAARRLASPTEVHVAYVVPDRGGVTAAAAPGGRAGLAAHLGRPVPAWVDGVVVEERLAERRRLAWFPRPLGPHHAASAPGLESMWVPQHLSVATVRTYVAASSLRAELLQAAGNLARWEPTRRRLVRWAERPAPLLPGTRWACVAEVAERTDPGRDVAPVRGWANGRDPSAVTAALLVALADAVVTSPPRRGGLLAPALVAPADRILDAVAATGALRWAVTDRSAR